MAEWPCPVIDAHTHILPEYLGLAVEVMERAGIETCVNLAWHDGFDDGLMRYLEAAEVYPGRFLTFGNLEFQRINEPDFVQRSVEQLRAGARLGMRGLKIYKNLGLKFKKPDGNWWRPNDSAFDPIWAVCGELGLPILIHSADPPNFWHPADKHNSWSGVLFGEYAEWTYYRKGCPSSEELLSERVDVARRFPGTKFIFPHCGERADSLELAADELAALPNVVYDLSARLPEMAGTPRRAAQAREFVQAHSDRILFGTDAIYDRTNVPTGQQAQILHQPGALPLEGCSAEESYIRTTADFTRSNIEFLTSAAVQTDAPFVRTQQKTVLYGLGLSEEICARILGGNVLRLMARFNSSLSNF